MKQTAVQWLFDNLIFEPWAESHYKHNSECWDKAIEMEKEQMNLNKCYHPLTERKHTSDTHFECTICGYNNY